jgi:hypothetical protein
LYITREPGDRPAAQERAAAGRHLDNGIADTAQQEQYRLSSRHGALTGLNTLG